MKRKIRFKPKKAPVEPVRIENKSGKLDLDYYENFLELTNDIHELSEKYNISYKKFQIENEGGWDDNQLVIRYEYVETDEQLEKRMERYAKEKQVYDKWLEENHEEYEAYLREEKKAIEAKKEKELSKERKRLEREEKQFDKRLKEVQKRLSELRK